MLSLPSRECGLKYDKDVNQAKDILSLPSRECGLKCLLVSEEFRVRMSLPSRECGLKYAGKYRNAKG